MLAMNQISALKYLRKRILVSYRFGRELESLEGIVVSVTRYSLEVQHSSTDLGNVFGLPVSKYIGFNSIERIEVI